MIIGAGGPIERDIPMTHDQSERRETVPPESLPKSVYGLPDWVAADWPTEDDLGVEIRKPDP
jgi:hypothetical protein